jgi:hypothetical protein
VRHVLALGQLDGSEGGLKRQPGDTGIGRVVEPGANYVPEDVREAR